MPNPGPKPKYKPENNPINISKTGTPRGPRPTPTAVLKDRGSWIAKQREAAGEPIPISDEPDIPDWVDEKARKYWPEIVEQLVGLQICARSDGLGIGLLCNQLADYVEARAILLKHGSPIIEEPVVSRKTGEVVDCIMKPHPAVSISLAAWDRTLKAAKEFGLTASSRTAVRIERDLSGNKQKDSRAKLFTVGA